MIYIIKHKEVETPKIKGYKELGVGECFKGHKDNINHLNPYINELTGVYDIWKNCKDDIKGQIAINILKDLNVDISLIKKNPNIPTRVMHINFINNDFTSKRR